MASFAFDKIACMIQLESYVSTRTGQDAVLAFLQASGHRVTTAPRTYTRELIAVPLLASVAVAQRASWQPGVVPIMAMGFAQEANAWVPRISKPIYEQFH